jgi:hypothetical protein
MKDKPPPCPEYKDAKIEHVNDQWIFKADGISFEFDYDKRAWFPIVQ